MYPVHLPAHGHTLPHFVTLIERFIAPRPTQQLPLRIVITGFPSRCLGRPNPTAHNSGYVYISRTPFNGGRVPTFAELRGQSGVREIYGSFLTPPRAPRSSFSYLSGLVQTTAKPNPRPQFALREAYSTTRHLNKGIPIKLCT